MYFLSAGAKFFIDISLFGCNLFGLDMHDFIKRFKSEKALFLLVFQDHHSQ
jgi:hypothetical protein